jgi:hypothetical protein
MNIRHYKESATIRNLKPEWWGSPFVEEEKYQEKLVIRGEIIIIIIISSFILDVCSAWRQSYFRFS